MFDYREFSSRLHTRGVNVDERMYLFAIMVCAGEDESVAYGLSHDMQEFKKNVPSEDELTYLSSVKQKAELLMQTQEYAQLREVIEESIRSEIQSKATNLNEYKYSSQEIVNMLSALLADRSKTISDASVRDIVQLIRELGALGGFTGSDGFENHFIQIMPKFNALCTSCGHEFEAHSGIGAICTHCHQSYRWSEEEQRFYPQPSKL